MTRREEAIAFIREDIEIHRQWSAHLGHRQTCGECSAVPLAAIEDIGDVAHHLEWIRRLEIVLAELQGTPA